MNTILVPTDFSDGSINAGKYALGLAKEAGFKKVIFYHTYSVPSPVTYGIIPTETIILNEEFIDYESLKEISLSGLNTFQDTLKEYISSTVEIELLPKYGFLTDDIAKTQQEVKADVIVMSIAGGGVFTENIIGSDTVVVARHSTIPVIVVPHKCVYNSLGNILLLSDFIDIDTTIPAEKIKVILNETKAQLNILHIAKDKATNHFNENSAERFVFEDLFEGYNPKFYFEVNHDFVNGINHFAATNNIDLVIIVPKKHSLLESLFIKNHTKELAFHSHIPLMVINN
jgi:nucleotide-binding universal stress UspA family protein